MSPASTLTVNPYVGPRSLRNGEHLHGRDRELANLRDTLIAERIVLLYSPSGAGKSSLLESGLRPELTRQGFRVAPTIRVGHEPPAGSRANRYVYSTLSSLEGADWIRRPAAPDASADTAEAMTIAPDAADSGTGGRAQSLVHGLDATVGIDRSGGELCLFFDQFEEVFTLDAVDHEAKTEFFEQLGDLLRDREVWAIFAMREDYIAQLDPYLQLIPRRLGSRVRLDFLNVPAASETIRRPAREMGVEFTDEALSRLLDDLRTVRTERGGEVVQELGQHIEPVQMQVVCRQLWARLPEGAMKIETAEVGQLADTNDALGRFYDEQISEAAAATGASERAIRDWFEGTLITPLGFRAQASEFPGSQGAAVLRELENSYLIRADRRRGVVWYELTHDRMITPVLENNADWSEEQLVPFQRMAIQWHTSGESETLLARGEPLTVAEGWAAEHDNELTATDRDYLTASRRAEDARLADFERNRIEAEKLRKRNRRNLIAAAAAIAALVAIGLTLKNERTQRDHARSARRIAESSALQTGSLGEADPYVGLLLSLESEFWTKDPLPGSRSSWAAASAQLALAAAGRLASVDTGDGETLGVAWSPDGSQFVTASNDGSIMFFDKGGELIRGPIAIAHGAIWAIAWSPDGAKIVAAASDQKAYLLHADGTPLHDPLPTSQDRAHDSSRGASWNKTSDRFVVGNADSKTARIFGVDGSLVAEFESGLSSTRTASWSPVDDIIAVGNSKGSVTLVNGDGQTLVEPFITDLGSTWSISWSPDGREFAVSGDDHRIRIYTSHGRPVSDPFDVGRGSSYGVAWSPDGKYIANVNDDGYLRFLTPEGTLVGQKVWTGERGSHTLAWSPTDPLIVVGNDDGTAKLFETTSLLTPGIIGLADPRPTTTAWSSTGTVAIGYEKGVVELYDSNGAKIGDAVTSIEISEGEDTLPEVNRVAWSHDGSRLAVVYAKGGGEPSTQIFEATGVPVGDAFVAGTDEPLDIAWGPNNDTIVVANSDGTAQTFDTDGEPTGEPFATKDPSNNDSPRTNGASWSPDGKFILASSEDGSARFFRPDGTPASDSFKTGTDHTAESQWSPDSTQVLILNEDGTARVYGPDARQTGPVFRSERDQTTGIAWNQPDGLIAMGTIRGAVQIVNQSDGAIVSFTSTGDRGETDLLAWSPDGLQLLYSNDSDGEGVRIWSSWTEPDACAILRRVFTVSEMDKALGIDGATSKCAHGEPLTDLPRLPTLTRIPA